MISRREWLAGAAAAGTLRSAGHQPHLMLQPYVWTQWFAQRKISLADGLERMFTASHRAGYRRMELIDSFLAPELRERTAALVRQSGFEVPVVYRGGAFHEAETARRSI